MRQATGGTGGAGAEEGDTGGGRRSQRQEEEGDSLRVAGVTGRRTNGTQ
jgi:hypothetical protein